MLATEEIGSSSNKDWQWHKSQNPPGASAWPSVAPHLLRLSAQGGTSDCSDCTMYTRNHTSGCAGHKNALMLGKQLLIIICTDQLIMRYTALSHEVLVRSSQTS